MLVSSTFQQTRSRVTSIDEIKVSTILIELGWTNYNARKPRAYHVHVCNSKNIYATIILTASNDLTLRGKKYTKLSDLFNAIEALEN